MKKKLMLLVVAIVGVVCSALYRNCAFTQDEDGNTPLHSLVFEAEYMLRTTLKQLHDQEAYVGEEHTKEYKRWLKMLRRKLLRIDCEYLSDLNRLRSDACFAYMITAPNKDGETIGDLLETFPILDTEDAEYLGIKYQLINRFYNTLDKLVPQPMQPVM